MERMRELGRRSMIPSVILWGLLAGYLLGLLVCWRIFAWRIAWNEAASCSHAGRIDEGNIMFGWSSGSRKRASGRARCS